MNLALDIGATNIRIAEVSGKKIKNRQEIKTPETKSGIQKALFSLISSYPKPDNICIGVAAFTKNGKTYGTPNMDFNHVDIPKLLKKYKVPVYVDNDANCAGLAEKYFGHGKKRKNFLVLTLGTGIGGAIFLNGKLYHGSGFAGEPGQTLIYNQRLETLASGPASLEIAKKYGFEKITSLELEKEANEGNLKARNVYREIGHYIGTSILNFSYILDPEIIILGGGFAKVKHIYPEIFRILEEEDMIPRKLRVVHAKLSDDAGLIGAALLPREFPH